MSIAVEFENGRDLTFIWSTDLPVSEHFHYPLPGRHDRETHVVARSGNAELCGKIVFVAGGTNPIRLARGNWAANADDAIAQMTGNKVNR